MNKRRDYVRTRELVTTTLLLGIGLGGFVDGIVFHQILQWHQMLSAQLPPVTLLYKEVNMFYDGIFHAATWLITFVGIIRLWRITKARNAYTLSSRVFYGGLIAGWAVFNIVEGVFDHYLFNLHNVRELVDNVMFWNHLFMGVSVALLIVGGLLIYTGQKPKGKSIEDQLSMHYTEENERARASPWKRS